MCGFRRTLRITPSNQIRALLSPQSCQWQDFGANLPVWSPSPANQAPVSTVARSAYMPRVHSSAGAFQRQMVMLNPQPCPNGGVMGGCKLVLTNTFVATSPNAAVPLLMRIVSRSAFNRVLRGMLSDKLQDESRGSQLPSRMAVLTVSARLTACPQHWAGPGGTVSHNADLSGPVASGGQRVV
jgi:hypothetical protein